MNLRAVARNLRDQGPYGLLTQLSHRIAEYARRYEPVPEIPLEQEADPLKPQLLQRNERFREMYAGRRAFVIGNGPSLNSQNLTHLLGETVITANSFWKHPLLGSLSPDAHCFADPMWFQGRERHEGELAEVRRRLPETHFFVPMWARPAVTSAGLLPAERTYYCDMVPPIFDCPDFSFDLTGEIPSVSTVTQMAIMVALYMGCSPVYLIGMDHSWLATPAGLEHFYAPMTPDELSRATSEPPRQTYRELLEYVTWVWDGHANLRSVAERAGRSVVNASEGGFLDVYERVDFESLF